jgi:osmotically-inducible protein OsmY
MANPIETLTKVAGYGFQQGGKLLGGAIAGLQGLTGRGDGGHDGSPPEEKQQTRAQEQRQRTQKAASQRRASQQPKDLDDVAITRKVETEIFRGDDVDKGKINVNTADGVVWLRGEAKNPEQVQELEAKAKAIPEVKRVENLLHLPKTPAPTRTDTPPSQRKTRSSTRRPTARKVETGITNERRTTHGEALPEETARQGEGRQPSPLGSNGGGS